MFGFKVILFEKWLKDLEMINLVEKRFEYV